MNIRTDRTTPQLARSPLALLLAFLATTAHGQADDPNPYYIGVSQAFTHDSNVYRVPSGGARSDTYSSTGLLGGFDQLIGRQRVYANGSIQTNRFNQLDTLNNTSYSLIGGVDWATIERLSGTVRLTSTQNLASFATTNQLLLNKKNVETNNVLVATGQLGLASLLSLNTSVTYRQLRYSAVEYNSAETDQTGVSVGLKYRPSALLTLGAALRHTNGNYPEVKNPDGSDYAFQRNDLDLTASWIATGQSTIDGRLSIGRQRYDTPSQRDFSGTTGAVIWKYRPTGKLSFTTLASRDTGNETSLQSLTLNGVSGTVNGDNSRLTTLLSVNGSYAATGKIGVNAGARYIHRSLANTLGTPSTSADGSDDTQSYTLGATYLYSRSLQFGCNLSRDTRRVSDDTPITLSYPFTATTASCSAQLTIQ